MMTVSQEEIANTIEISDEDAKRIYQDRLSPLLDAGAPAGPADIVSQCGRGQGGVRAHHRRARLRRSRQGTQPGRQGHRSRHRHQGRHHRPGRGQCRLRARRRRRQRPGDRALRHRDRAGAEDRAGRDQVVRRRRDRDQARHRARPRQGRGQQGPRQGRGGVRRRRLADRDRPEAQHPLRTIDAVDRSGRAPDGQPVADLPTGVDVVNSAFNTEIGNENDPLALPGGGYRLVRRRRHHAVARAQARRGQGPGRGALARGRGRQAPRRQDHRDHRQAQVRHLARRHRGSRRASRSTPNGASSGRAPISCQPRVISADLPHRQGRDRQLRGPERRPSGSSSG